ncbi:hypothetical protein OKW22_000029 [Bacilli bacterium PM5-3]|nr:hypothetical protein [Bacilli bacterium PM5-3]
MKKRKIIALLMIAVVLCGCSKNYTDDFAKKYDKYLKYAFNYYYIEKKVVEYNSSPIPGAGTYLEWNIKYNDNEKVERDFTFQNYWYTDNYSKLASQIFFYAKERVNEEISSDKYVKLLTNKITYKNANLYTDLEIDEKNYDMLIDEVNGIDFVNFDIKKLNKYYAKYQISFVMELNDKDKLEKTKEKLMKNIAKGMREFRKETQTNEITFECNIYNKTKKYKATYKINGSQITLIKESSENR